MSKRFQTIGSLLRSQKLLSYKHRIEQRDDITYPFYDDFEGYEEREFEAARDAVNQQIQHGFEIITDGEYSKSMWHLDFVWGPKDISRYAANHGYFLRDKDGTQKYETRRDIGLRITGPPSGRNHHFTQVFKHLQPVADDKETETYVPSSSHTFGELLWSDSIGGKDSVYSTIWELRAGLVQVYQEFAKEYATAGGRTLQFDDCLWKIFVDDNPSSPYTGENIGQDTVRTLVSKLIDINSMIIGFGRSLGLRAWTYNCRGNYDSRNVGGGLYLKIANLFLKQLEYDCFFLEQGDDRADSLKALAVSQKRPNMEVVFGLLSNKTNTLDDETCIFRPLDEASRIIPKERLLLLYQCGFTSCDGGSELTEDEQWVKTDQSRKIALQCWGK